jgi:hypothetical protein
MRDAAVPGDDQQIIAGQHVAKHVRVRKNRAKHGGPGHDALAIHRARSEQIIAVEKRLGDQRSGDSMCDGVHNFAMILVLLKNQKP